MAEKTGIDLIAEERKRQIEQEGWSETHDSDYIFDELAIAGACYAVHATHVKVVTPKGKDAWPWEAEYDKRQKHLREKGRIRCLQIAGALIAAEIDRLLLEEKHYG